MLRGADTVRGRSPGALGWLLVKVTVLVGGVGGARFLQGVRELLGRTSFPDVLAEGLPPSEHEVTAVVNVGDDAWMHGVRICPDLDTCMYTLGDGIDTDRGWGRRGETWHAKEELAAYGADPDWFGLGDRDLATHLIRTQMLDAGYRLSDITAALCRRWDPGVRLLPATDDRHETHVVVTRPIDAAKQAADGTGVRRESGDPLSGMVGPAPRPDPDAWIRAGRFR